MKKQKTVFAVMAAILMGSLLFNCQKESYDPIAIDVEVAFAIDISNLENETQLKSTMDYSLAEADKIILTIQNSDGSPSKYTSYEVKIRQLNGYYYTQKIVLKTGDYRLTEFLILDDSDSTIFVTPVTGSLEAQNVNNPLPIEFTVTKNVTTPISVEVLSTEKKTPEDFGLNHFHIIEIKTFGFIIGVANIESDEIISAILTVSNGSYIYIQNLDSILNNVVTIKDSLSNYTLAVEKIGYDTYIHTYSIDSLKMFKDTVGNLPLIVELKKSILEVSKTSPSNDLALYADASESDDGWGGGTSKTDITDGIRTYDGEWARGLALLYDTWQQVTIDFGIQITFNKVIQWYHGGMNNNEAAAYILQYWNGTDWVDIFETYNSHDYLKYPDALETDWWYYGSTPYENTFAPVISNKLRIMNYPLSGSHTWFYEVEVYND